MRKSSGQIIRTIPDTELTVMQILWEMEAPVKRADVEARMQQVHPVAQTTLLTLLTRLSEKEFIRIEKQGRSSVYTPLVSKEDYLANQSKRFLDRLCLGNISAFAAALTDSGISKEDIAELRALLKEQPSDTGTKGRR